MEQLKTCHQCRQRKKNLMAICKNSKAGKQCPLKFCERCLFNRYEEKVKEVEELNNWTCPKCRDQCNCSFCLKRKGHKPTGKLVRTVKGGGHSSASQMPALKGEDIFESMIHSNTYAAASTTTLKYEMVAVPSGKQESSSINDVSKEMKKIKKKAKAPMWIWNFNDENETITKSKCQESGFITLPHAATLTHALDMEFALQDVGSALQFLEFSVTFGEVVGVKQVEAEAILRQLVREQNLRRGKTSLATQFQIKLLTLILSESEEGCPTLSSTDGTNLWFEALVKLISRSSVAQRELQLGSLLEGIDKYYELDLSKKLLLLNFLCDEVVATKKLRSFINNQNSNFVKKVKEAKAKVSAAIEKEKSLKQKLHNEETKTNVSENEATLIPTSEQEALLSQMRSEAAEAHARVLEAKGLVLKRQQRSNALRTEPMFLDSNGQRFWKLKCYGDEDALLMQEIKIQDAVEERWFVYGTEKKHEIDMYISSRTKKAKKSKTESDYITTGDDISESNMVEGAGILNDSCRVRDDCSEANIAENEVQNDLCIVKNDINEENIGAGC